MPETKSKARERPRRCEICHQEIPASAAMTAEGRDYTWYFCGADCYGRWKEKLPPQAVAYLRQPSSTEDR